MSVTVFILLLVAVLAISGGSTYVAFKMINATKVPPKDPNWDKDEWKQDEWDKDEWKNGK